VATNHMSHFAIAPAHQLASIIPPADLHLSYF
jgi:hypothetical protein